MKTQMKFQKWLSLSTIIIGAIVFIFAICFNSGNLADLMYYESVNIRNATFAADDFLAMAQSFSSLMLGLAIAYIVIGVVVYITATNSRRNYYISNKIVAIALIAYIVAVSVIGLVYIFMLVSSFYAINWTEIYDVYEIRQGIGAPEVTQSPTMFIIGIVVFIITIANALAWLYNLIWKIKLMKGEKALLEKGSVKEVA